MNFRFSTLICTHYVYVHLFLIVINILCSRQVLHILPGSGSRSSARIWVMSPPLLALPRTSCRHRESRTSRASLILGTLPEASCSRPVARTGLLPIRYLATIQGCRSNTCCPAAFLQNKRNTYIETTNLSL